MTLWMECRKLSLKSYETADFILFVSSAVSGGISQAEAAWLRMLRERYTQEGLRQRLIFVLTKCGQADREQLPGIVERFRQDLENTVGFRAVIPVDSVTYQKGAVEGKALLVEHSGIPDLEKQLAEKIAAADKLLALYLSQLYWVCKSLLSLLHLPQRFPWLRICRPI